MRWTPLVKATIQTCGSPPRLYYNLKFLEKNGFVVHESVEGKLYWMITEKGKELLNVFSRG
jgi:DNA-binding PadR family transcriptional regulator